MIQQVYDPTKASRMRVMVMSFGFKRGALREADYVFDCRLLPNPYFVEGLREKDGRDPDVVGYLAGLPDWPKYLALVLGLLDFAVPLHEAEGKPVLTIGFGCTGGRHRSVAVAEAIGAALRERGLPVHVQHRDIGTETT